MHYDATGMPSGSLDDTSRVNVDSEILHQTLLFLYQPFEGFPQAIMEMRIPNVPHCGTVSGYFSDLAALGEDR
jgi:hypothetical protein